MRGGERRVRLVSYHKVFDKLKIGRKNMIVVEVVHIYNALTSLA
jgi:hypothetical protein